MHTCAYTYTHTNTHSHTLIHTHKLSQSELCFIVCVLHFLPIQETYSFPDNVYFFLGIYVEVFRILNLEGLLRNKNCLNVYLFYNT